MSRNASLVLIVLRLILLVLLTGLTLIVSGAWARLVVELLVFGWGLL